MPWFIEYEPPRSFPALLANLPMSGDRANRPDARGAEAPAEPAAYSKRSKAELCRMLAERDAVLAEHDLLMREASHRVKNSLHLLVSALRMQASRCTAQRDEADYLIRASQRIKSVALVHDSLHRSTRGTHIEFGAYLRSLCADLEDSMALLPGQRIRVTAEEGHIPDERAIRLGLIASELVTNALKHGCSAEGGDIEVGFARISEDSFALSVADHGTGISDSFDPTKSAGLGMRLVNVLTQALGAELRFERTSPGTCFVVTLPAD
ncbi:sensor histidine kinase [Roseomonas sp. SSH11]|uniref:histidine kinase n=1 Tax=Pararoseomonas baculiformis TaxID=2820812 RepID=A0ABS4AG53_9PROT|nr:sensor histidine kinase [Pararoseomonas baculiformis]MBP0445194.1 sensor histidine kinase [Pararoseomonas baculiformis]